MGRYLMIFESDADAFEAPVISVIESGVTVLYAGEQSQLADAIVERVIWSRDNLKGRWRLTDEAPFIEASNKSDQAMIRLRWAGE